MGKNKVYFVVYLQREYIALTINNQFYILPVMPLTPEAQIELINGIESALQLLDSVGKIEAREVAAAVSALLGLVEDEILPSAIKHNKFLYPRLGREETDSLQRQRAADAIKSSLKKAGVLDLAEVSQADLDPGKLCLLTLGCNMLGRTVYGDIGPGEIMLAKVKGKYREGIEMIGVELAMIRDFSVLGARLIVTSEQFTNNQYVFPNMQVVRPLKSLVNPVTPQ